MWRTHYNAYIQSLPAKVKLNGEDIDRKIADRMSVLFKIGLTLILKL